MSSFCGLRRKEHLPEEPSAIPPNQLIPRNPTYLCYIRYWVHTQSEDYQERQSTTLLKILINMDPPHGLEN
jgi:hypothetical protein